MKILLLWLLCLMVAGCAGAEDAPDDAPLVLTALNVGKADCLLLQSGSDAYLIDTGTKASADTVTRALDALGVERLTGVILTHTDSDHAGGAKPLAKTDLPVGAWYASKYYTDIRNEKKHPAVKAASERGLEVVWLEGGMTLPLDGGTLTVLGPLTKSDKENCNSVVLLVEGGGGKMLLTGDMEFPEEAELLAAGLIPRCDVLKVGNHGESDASSEAFIYTVRPRIAVISTSTAEEPDTPAKRVLKALMAVGAQIEQTQKAALGIRVTLSGGEVTVERLGLDDVSPAR